MGPLLSSSVDMTAGFKGWWTDLKDLDWDEHFNGWDFLDYGQISGFKHLSESNENSFEMHFECGFSRFRVQT